MRGSGYTEILVDAQMVTSGSLKGILRGKAYTKSLFCLKTVCEAMERLLLERFCEEENLTIADQEVLLSLVNSCNCKQLEAALNDESATSMVEKYES